MTDLIAKRTEGLIGWLIGSLLVAACNPTSAPIAISLTAIPTLMPLSVTVRDGWHTYADIDKVHDLALDHDGTLWAATEDGIISLNPANNTYIRYTTRHGLASNDTSAIAVGRDGTVWVGTSNNGIARFDGKTWVPYTSANGLASDRITFILAAPNDELWVGTFFGASHFDGQSWRSNQADLARGHVMAVALATDGTVWYGTWENGIWHSNGQTMTVYTGGDGLVSNDVNAVTIDAQDRVWAGTNGGVSYFDGKTWTSYTQAIGLAGNEVESIAVAPDGTLWLGTWCTGVAHRDADEWITYTTNEGLVDDCVRAVTVAPDGTPWFGTPHGISHFLPPK